MFKGNDPIPLGAYVKDRLNDFSGYVAAKFYFQSGCCGIWIESPTELKDGKPLCRNVDSRRVTVLPFDEEHQNLYGNPNSEECIHNLGVVVRDDRTGLQGVVSAITFSPDNVPHVEILPPYNYAEGKQPEMVSVPDFMAKCVQPATPTPHPAQGTSGDVPRSWE